MLNLHQCCESRLFKSNQTWELRNVWEVSVALIGRYRAPEWVSCPSLGPLGKTTRVLRDPAVRRSENQFLHSSPVKARVYLICTQICVYLRGGGVLFLEEMQFISEYSIKDVSFLPFNFAASQLNVSTMNRCCKPHQIFFLGVIKILWWITVSEPLRFFLLKICNWWVSAENSCLTYLKVPKRFSVPNLNTSLISCRDRFVKGCRREDASRAMKYWSLCTPPQKKNSLHPTHQQGSCSFSPLLSQHLSTNKQTAEIGSHRCMN